MAYELKYSVDLAPESQARYNEFIDQNKNKSEVTFHDVYELVAKGAALFSTFKLVSGKKTSLNEQKQLLMIMYQTLVKDDKNGFEDQDLSKFLNIIYGIRNGEFEVDFGRKGLGWLGCCSSVKVSIKE